MVATTVDVDSALNQAAKSQPLETADTGCGTRAPVLLGILSGSPAKALVNVSETSRCILARPPKRLDEQPIPAKAQHQNIRISPAVLDAAVKDGDELLRYLRTAPGGITQTEAEARASTTGPNEVAQ
jgi:hypothetical protein